MILPASQPALAGREADGRASTTPATVDAAANRTLVPSEMDINETRAMGAVSELFVDESQSSLSELRWKVGRRTLPGASFLTRPGHVLCPDKKHPASARALEPRLPRSWLPWPRRFRPISRSLPSDAAIWLS
tara:strand:- start:83 stop:478 length:396 start_codon:yes stop_codon:yes gene_type:complete